MDAKKQALLAQLQSSISSIEQGKEANIVRKASKSKKSTRGSFSKEMKEELPLSFSDEFLSEDDSSKAFKKICDLVKVRDRSVHETRKRLKDLEFSEQGIEEAIQKAIRCSYLDDKRFAGVYVRSKFNQGKGFSGIRNDLKSHGISEEIIEFAFSDNAPVDSEEERALDYLRRKPSHSKNLFQSCYGKLVRRGFSSSVAVAATKKWMNEQVH